MIDMIEELYEEKIRLAEAGNKAAAEWLLEEFCATVKNNRDKNGKQHRGQTWTHTQFHEGMLDYFAKCFSEILDGVKADKALGINTGVPGADAMLTHEKNYRDSSWCIDVLRFKDSGKYSTIEQARAAVARKHKVSQGTIDKAWKNSAAKDAAVLALRLEKEEGK